jgi:hypothetical protein
MRRPMATDRRLKYPSDSANPFVDLGAAQVPVDQILANGLEFKGTKIVRPQVAVEIVYMCYRVHHARYSLIGLPSEL